MRRQISAAPPAEPRQGAAAGGPAAVAGSEGSEAGAGDNLQIFDRDRTLALCGDDYAFAREIVTLYLDSTEALLTALDEAISAGDAETIYSSAHTLKGAASNIGADRTQAVARRLMQMADGGQLDACGPALAELQRNHAELIETLDRFLHDHQSGESCES